MRIYVTPKPGMIIRDPKTMEPLPPDGAVKEAGKYWTRRERDGDVIITPAPAQDEPHA